MFLGIVGDLALNQFDDAMQVTVRSGDTVVVKNVDPANTLAYLSQGFNGGTTGTVATSASQSFSQVGTVYLVPNTGGQRVAVQITGGSF